MIRPAPRVLLVASALAVCLVGCRDADDGEQTPPQPEEAPVAEPEPAPAAEGSAPRVELLSEGAEPRRELRYDIEAETSERAEMTFDMDMVLGIGDLPPERVSLPPLVMEIAVDIEEMGDDQGRYRFEFTSAEYEPDPSVDPSLLRTLEREIDQVVGTRGHTVFDARGFNLDSEIEMPAGASPQVEQMMESLEDEMEQLAVPFPAEPVGEGASWQVTQHLDHQGLSIEQTSTLTLESLEDDQGVVSMTHAQDAPRQTVEVDDMPGATSELLELSGSGEGEHAFDLGRILPVRANMDGDFESTFETDVGGQTQRMTLDMEIALELESME